MLRTSRTEEKSYDPLEAGLKCVDDKDYAKAIKYFTEELADEENINKDLVRYHRGKAYLKNNEFEKAAADLQLIKDKDFHQIYYYLGKTWFGQKDHDEAIEILLYHVRKAVLDFKAWNLLGLVYLDVNNQEEACKCFLQVLLMDSPKNKIACDNLVKINPNIVRDQLFLLPEADKDKLLGQYLKITAELTSRIENIASKPVVPAITPEMTPTVTTSTAVVLQSLSKSEEMLSVESSSETESETLASDENVGNINVQTPASKEKAEFEKFKKDYADFRAAKWFNRPWSKMSRNIGVLYDDMPKVRAYAEKYPESTTAKVLKKNGSW